MAKTVIDLKGNTIIADEFVGDAVVPAATTAVAGVVKKGAAVPNTTPAADGTAAGTSLNALLASLRAAGVITT